MLEMRRFDAKGQPHAADAVAVRERGHRGAADHHQDRVAAGHGAIGRAPLDLHFHDLRREAASRWLDAGVRLTQIQKLLGHTTREQTATYLASALNAEHDAMAAFDAHREAERERELARQREAEARLQVFANEVGKGVQNGVNESTTGDSRPEKSLGISVLH